VVVKQREHGRQVQQCHAQQQKAEHDRTDHDEMRAPEAAPMRHTGGAGVIHASNPRRATPRPDLPPLLGVAAGNDVKSPRLKGSPQALNSL
jgi:hypothetical protein